MHSWAGNMDHHSSFSLLHTRILWPSLRRLPSKSEKDGVVRKKLFDNTRERTVAPLNANMQLYVVRD
jgi:hypothetical protein